MNPEFQRNLWLELTARRVVLMALLLGLIFVAVALSAPKEFSVGGAAEWLFYFIVILWGTRNAATAVVGEIRERTWDMQRLSSLTPGQMTWAKLFGSTIFNWFGGAICLAVITFETATAKGPAAALTDIAYYLVIGVIAQASSLLVSLVAARRRQNHSRFDIFVYQIAGIAAAFAVRNAWSDVDPASPYLAGADTVGWWGMAVDARLFALASLGVFAAWIMIGCYREMRLELQMRNGPLVWLAFLVFMGVYVTGFDAQKLPDEIAPYVDAEGQRMARALILYIALVYVMVIVEPKDRVHYRWLGAQIASGRLGAFFSGLESWMMSYAAAVVMSLVLLAWWSTHLAGGGKLPASIIAMLGFMTRDVSIFIALRGAPGRRRGDLAAMGTLFAIYVLAPVIVKGLGADNLLMVFLPAPSQPVWLGPAIAWGEGIALAVFAFSRASIRNTPAGRSQPSPAS